MNKEIIKKAITMGIITFPEAKVEDRYDLAVFEGDLVQVHGVHVNPPGREPDFAAVVVLRNKRRIALKPVPVNQVQVVRICGQRLWDFEQVPNLERLTAPIKTNGRSKWNYKDGTASRRKPYLPTSGAGSGTSAVSLKRLAREHNRR